MISTCRSRTRLLLLALAVVAPLKARPANAAACPRGISSAFTATEDIIETSTGMSCITVNANVTVNLAGFSIICRASGGQCTTAVTIAHSGVTVKNGYIIHDTQSWFEGILDNTVSPDSTITDVTFDTVSYGVYNPTLVQNCVFRNIGNTCILATDFPSSGNITQNYCVSSGDGIVVNGASGTPKIQRNYVRAVDSGIDTSATSATITVQQNIVDVGSPFFNPGSGTTLSKNLCPDATDCPDPDSNFGLTLTFNP